MIEAFGCAISFNTFNVIGECSNMNNDRSFLLMLLHPFWFFRVFCVRFSCDASYVISGSDDTNLRLWKAKASEQLGVVRILSLFIFAKYLHLLELDNEYVNVYSPIFILQILF